MRHLFKPKKLIEVIVMNLTCSAGAKHIDECTYRYDKDYTRCTNDVTLLNVGGDKITVSNHGSFLALACAPRAGMF